MTTIKHLPFSLILFFLATELTLAQEVPATDPSSFAASFSQPYEDAASLAMQLTAPFRTEGDKAEAIFAWIANNVRYDCSKFHHPPKPAFNARTKEELDQKVAEYEQKEVEKTAKYKKGICEDYSRLFKAMCDAVGIEAAVIHGDARDFYKPYRSARDNPHAWNAVKIDGQWHLLDATWAAGYTDAGVSKFTRKLAPGFFKTPPAWFVQNHLPENPDWQLLAEPLDRKAFIQQPLINYGQWQYAILDFPASVQAVSGKDYDREVRIKFETAPTYFMLTNRKSKPIPFSHTMEGGYAVFRFSGRGAGEVVIFGGESKRSRMDWLAQYDL